MRDRLQPERISHKEVAKWHTFVVIVTDTARSYAITVTETAQSLAVVATALVLLSATARNMTAVFVVAQASILACCATGKEIKSVHSAADPENNKINCRP